MDEGARGGAGEVELQGAWTDGRGEGGKGQRSAEAGDGTERTGPRGAAISQTYFFRGGGEGPEGMRPVPEECTYIRYNYTMYRPPFPAT